MSQISLIRAATLSILLVSLAVPVLADPFDDYVKAQIQERNIPGLSIAVVRDGQVVKAQGYGLANIELNAPATAETIYQSGSLGKQFTATLVMMLVEEGKIRLDESIRTYMPEAPATWQGITIRHLLTHTAGVSNKLYDNLDMRQDYTEEELFKRITALPLDFQPGEKWAYSNCGYMTLGFLIHRVSGKFYGDLLQERIFGPLGMTTARIISEADIIPNRAAGYLLKEGKLRNQEWVSPSLNTTADGSLYLTVLDLAKWDAALYTEKLLKKASLDLMWTPVKLNDGKTEPYGFGWFIGNTNGHRVIQHGGAWQGFTSNISRWVDDRLTVIVLTNRLGSAPEQVGRGAAAFYVPELAPRERKAIKVDPRIVDEYVGDYELVPGFVLTVSREGDQYWSQATGQPRVELFAESETEFFLRIVDAQLTFVRDAGGKVTHLVLHQGGTDREAKKIR
ncbi:MAG TPA: serine hydrolase [Thermoanaerobaculia bacterium]|jgi:CubicO group peptidase (beta-lactamase class C family)|nr:serine hydrolase [Thermoanaerobaculia bacterium]